jgi:hypothetical protein
VEGAISLEVKRPGREADHIAPSNGEVKKAQGQFYITSSLCTVTTGVKANIEEEFLNTIQFSLFF